MSKLSISYPSAAVKAVIYTLILYQSVNLALLISNISGVLKIGLSASDVWVGTIDIIFCFYLAYGLYKTNKKTWLLSLIYFSGVTFFVNIQAAYSGEGVTLYLGFVMLFYGALLAILMSKGVLREFDIQKNIKYLKLVPSIFISVGGFVFLSSIQGDAIAFFEALAVFILLYRFYVACDQLCLKE